jgi:hypothetical protein
MFLFLGYAKSAEDKDVVMTLPKSCAVTSLALLLSLVTALPPSHGRELGMVAQDPAPQLAWEDWKTVGSCGGVEYLVAISQDDGRNDFELKIKINNQNSHTVQTRLNAVIESEKGEKKYRDNVGIGRLNAGRAVDACSITPSLCFGILFPSAVYQKTPTRISTLTLTNVDVANIDAPPANASPAAYLDPYRDYPNTKCRNLTVSFGGGNVPKFISLTDSCVKGLPRWTKPDCDDAVDEILKAYGRATSQTDQDCIKEWRTYQKCYEIYAFNSSPVPRPSCQRPTCKVK